MQTRPSVQGRKLFDAIYNATNSEDEERVIQMLASIASTDVNTNDPEAVTVFHLCCGLLDDKNDEITLLMAAVKVGSERLVKCIIDMVTFYHRNIPAYYDFDFMDKNGNTALLHAAKHGNLNILKLLVATGKCDPTVKNSAWQTALDIATIAKHHVIVNYLTEQFDIISKRRATLFANVSRLVTGDFGSKRNMGATNLNGTKP